MRLTMESQRSAKLLEATVTNVAHGIRVIDSEGRLVLWNQRYQDMLGIHIAIFDKEFRLQNFNSVFQSLYDFPDGFLERGRPYADVLHHLIERGEFGDVDADSFLRKRMSKMAIP